MPDQFRGPVCTAPVVVFQRRIEMAGVKCIGEIGEKYVRPSLFGCPMPPAKFVKKVLKLRRKPLPQLSQGPLQAAVRALKQELDVIALQPIYEKPTDRSEEQPSELQSLMRISYAVFCLKKKKTHKQKKQ